MATLKIDPAHGTFASGDLHTEYGALAQAETWTALQTFNAGITLPDNQAVTFGTGSDSSITYNGTNLVIDPDLVGSGVVSIAGAATVSSTLGVTGATTLSSTLGVTGAATLSSTLGVTGLITATVGLIVNESGADSDFRVEGVGQANLLVADASAAAIGIGMVPAGAFIDADGGSSTLMLRLTSAANFNVDFVRTGGVQFRMNAGAPGGATGSLFGNVSNHPYHMMTNDLIRLTVEAGGNIQVVNALEIDGALNHDGSTVGFYGTAPTALQTGVAVTAAAIHAALVNLGLITA